uniref:Plakophilin 2 n=1 Tax=Xenopus tropicalis TaxID=8364 RepID=A0A803JUZ5_XENTR
MALVMPPGGEQGYIRTVLGYEHFQELDSSTLALPSEERLKLTAKEPVDKAQRIQQQVRLTLARRGNKSVGNGSLHHASSLPEQVHYNGGFTHKDVFSSASKRYDTIKDGRYTGYENGVGGNKVTFSEWRSECDTRRPTLRRDVSPEGEREVSWSPFYPDAPSATKRYARSDIVGLNRYKTASRARQNLSQQFRQDTTDSVFAPSVPASVPASPIYPQWRHSRSMENLLEQHQVGQPGAVGQVRVGQAGQLGSTKAQTMRSKWNQSTVRTATKDSFNSTVGGVTFERRVPLLAGASGTLQMQRGGSQVEAHVGNVSSLLEVEMTLERAVNLLQSETSSSQWLCSAASFIQHECFRKSDARRQVYNLGGIPRLIRQLKGDSEEVQRASCAALRNLVFEDNDNKLEVCEQRGIPVALKLLGETQDLEIKRQITGLLWNLSSNDQLKSCLIRDALKPLTRTIIIPSSGWGEGEYSKSSALSDPDIFYNATGCLRNMSSAGPEGRKAMRDCEGLIDALVHYTRGSIADYKPDDKATENCVCILHNLSYQLEAELPGTYTQSIYRAGRGAPRSEEETVGCFGTRSRKIKEMPSTVAHMIIQKETGLQHIRNILNSSDSGVKRTAVSLLRNLSRYSNLQNEIAREVLPDLVRLVPGAVPETSVANETAASVCYVINNLISKSSESARAVLSNGGVPKLSSLSISDSNLATKTGKAASIVLYSMWAHQDLHSTYKKSLYKKADFVNPRTLKAYNSLRD